MQQELYRRRPRFRRGGPCSIVRFCCSGRQRKYHRSAVAIRWAPSLATIHRFRCRQRPRRGSRWRNGAIVPVVVGAVASWRRRPNTTRPRRALALRDAPSSFVVTSALLLLKSCFVAAMGGRLVLRGCNGRPGSLGCATAVGAVFRARRRSVPFFRSFVGTI